ncbi:MAG: SIR2 family protein [Chloroflexota bacterium]|nr:SIR2 family protein [Chloroflexota bacterium]
MSEKRIEALVRLLLDKDESERERTFEDMGTPPEERNEILGRLLERKERPPAGLSPQELRENDHFRQLVALTRRGKVILFVGAGVSVDAGMPSTGQLLDALRAEAKSLSVDIPSGTPFPEAARIVESVVGRQNMAEMLLREFENAMKADPPPYRKAAYRLLSDIPHLNRLIVTTNWDDLLRRALEDAGKSTTKVLEGTQLGWIPLAEHAIIKLHGDFENPNEMVITETDYAVATSQIARRTAGTLWGYVAALLAQYSFVFLGYNLADSDFRLLRRMVESGMETWRESAPHFLVAPLSQTDEKAASRWVGVNPIPATATNFLLALFRELDEFANRLDELDLVFRHPSPPFIEFHGHFGSGKSALLDRTEQRAKTEGWLPRQVVRVNWNRRRDDKVRDPIRNMQEIIQVLNDDLEPATPLKRFEEFASYLRDKRGVFLVFDGTEHVQNQRDLVLLLSRVAAPTIQEMNEKGERSKLLMGGRFPLQGWPYRSRRSLLSHALTPFDAAVVREMAHKFLLLANPDSPEVIAPTLVADILEISSGHAQFIKSILLDLVAEERRRDGRIRLPRHLAQEEKHAYGSQFNADIDRHVKWENPDLKQVYEGTLCVFRWLNREMVRELDLSVTDPLSNLTGIYVLSPDDFRADRVIRHTKASWLRYERPREYAEAHRQAQRLFAAGMERLVFPTQLDYTLEWLFHTAHLLIVEEPQDVEERLGKLIEQIELQARYRAYPAQVRGNVGAHLVRRITDEDQELWTVLETCASEEGIEKVLRILEEREVLDVGQC